jgi:hypothetical protein
MAASLLFMVSTAASVTEDTPKLYMPVREIDRPLSLPPKGWRLGVGAVVAPGMQGDSFYVDMDANLTDIQFPYVPIGRLAELHFPAPTIKIYALRNTAVRDSSIVISGPCLAFLAGLSSVWYSARYGFGISGGVGYQCKVPTSSGVWVGSSGWLDIGADRYLKWGSNAHVCVGAQVTENFAIIPRVFASFYQYRVYYVDTGRMAPCVGYTLELPLDFKINMNPRRGLLFRVGLRDRANTYSREGSFWGVPVGFQYSWAW